MDPNMSKFKPITALDPLHPLRPLVLTGHSHLAAVAFAVHSGFHAGADEARASGGAARTSVMGPSILCQDVMETNKVGQNPRGSRSRVTSMRWESKSMYKNHQKIGLGGRDVERNFFYLRY